MEFHRYGRCLKHPSAMLTVVFGRAGGAAQSADSKGVVRLMSIVPEREEFPERPNSPLKSRAVHI